MIQRLWGAFVRIVSLLLRTIMAPFRRRVHELESAEQFVPNPLAAKLTSPSVATAIRENRYQDLGFPNSSHQGAFDSYLRLCSLALHWRCERILEIGAGFSTYLWAFLAQRTGASVTVVDADFRLLEERLGHSEFALVQKHTQLVKHLTVSADDIRDFFGGKTYSSYAGVSAERIAHTVDMLEAPSSSYRRWQVIQRLTGVEEGILGKLLFDRGLMSFRDAPLDIFPSSRTFSEELAILETLGAESQILGPDDLPTPKGGWDLVFFDSGELSSTLEWEKLRSSIAIGGLAAFHDIWFPKSFKNVLPASCILASEDWKVIFIDTTTRQGMLVAERLR